MADGEQFVERDLRGVRFIECDLSDVVMRGVEIAGMEIDAPLVERRPGIAGERGRRDAVGRAGA